MIARNQRACRLVAATTRWASLAVFLAGASLLPMLRCGAQQPPIAAPPSWSREIAPIVYGNCTGCHHPGGAGPFSLLTYADARRWGMQVRTVTQSQYMPPWLPAQGYGDLADSRRLSAKDIAQIDHWVRAGMPEGHSADAPPTPHYTSEWQLGAPDMILTAAQPFTVPADGEDLFHNFILPAAITRTRYVRAIEIQPGNARVVHHANVLVDRTAELRRQRPNDWQAGVSGMEISIDSGDRFDPDSHFLFWKPDTPAVIEPPGMAWRLDPGADLILNTHLKPTGRVETVQPRVALYFTDQPPDRVPMLLQLEHDGALDIPAGDSHFVVEDELRLPIAVHALGIYPHAHYLGKRLKAWSVAPSGEKTPLILIPDWDIDRQSVYSYRKPLLLPAGSVLHMRYLYDNSAMNPRNPASPPVRVRAGNRSADEMGHLWLQVLPVHAMERDKTGHEEDARMLLERAWMEHRLERDPADRVAAYNLASLDNMSGDATGATAIYKKLAAASPMDARIATSLGVSEEQLGDWQAALAIYRRALTLDPAETDARYNLANLELQHDQPQAAATDYQTLLEKRPEDAAAHGGLGAALVQLQQSERARVEFERALTLDPSETTTLENYASLELAAGDAQKAQALLTRAIAAGGRDAATWQQLAFADAQTGHAADAEAALRSAIAANPKDPASHSLLAQSLAASGNLKAAIAEQQVALQIDPEDADGWSNLGVLQAQSGDAVAARNDFRHSLAIDPQHEQARANLARLDAKVTRP